MFADLEQTALKIDADYRTELDRVAKDDRLTVEGKIDAARTLETRRRDQVQRLQQQARDRHHQAMERAQADAKAARAAEIENRRRLLGDVILADFYRRQVSNSSGDEMLELIENAAPGFEAELIRGLAQLELSERTMMPNPNRADIQAWQQLQPEPAIDYELRLAGERIDQLDLGGYRQSAADRLGVDSRYVPSPF